MSRFPDRIIEYDKIGGNIVKDEKPVASAKKVKLTEIMSSDEIKKLLESKQKQQK